MASCNHFSHILRTAVTLLMAVSSLCGLFASSRPDYTVSLVTVDPGTTYYELEGHAALRIVGRGNDIMVNWGVFDFNSPNFLYRFVSGDTEYLCIAEPTEYFLSNYAQRSPGRGVYEQVIPLDSVQTAALIDKLTLNLLPENRYYHYNYVKDNCATRPLSVLEDIIGKQITIDTVPPAFHKGDSFRDVMRHFHANYPWYQFGIDLALGSGIDYPLTNREFLFAPAILRDMLPIHQTVLIPSSPDGVVDSATPFMLTPMAAGIYVLIILTTVILFGKKRGRLIKWSFTFWFTLLFIAGCVIAFLVFISIHEATTPNYNLLWLNPFCICGIISMWTRKLNKIWICYHFANFASIIAYSVVWFAGIQQGNVAFIPLLISDMLVSVTWLVSFSGLRLK